MAHTHRERESKFALLVKSQVYVCIARLLGEESKRGKMADNNSTAVSGRFLAVESCLGIYA